MSSTEQLNAAIAALNGAADGYNGKKAEIDAALAEALATAPDMERTYYVDLNGDDAATGLEGAPLETIAEAVSRCPSGGVLHLVLTSGQEIPITTTPGFLQTSARAISIRSSTEGVKALIKPHIAAATDDPTKSIAYGFSPSWQGCTFLFQNIYLATEGLAVGTATNYYAYGGIVTRGAGHQQHSPLTLLLYKTICVLKDHQMVSGYNTLDMDFTESEIILGGTQLTMNSGELCTARLNVRSLTMAAGKTLTDLFVGVHRDAAGVATNVLSNVAI